MATVGLALLMVASCAMFEKSPAKPEAAAKKLPDVREFGNKESSVIQSRDGMNVGVLHLNGRVEQTSLIRYFQNNMANEGWRQIGQFRSPQSLMIFQKGRRMAVIVIEDSDFETFADVWVVPMNESVDALAPK
jgi:hypothetical protein